MGKASIWLKRLLCRRSRVSGLSDDAVGDGRREKTRWSFKLCRDSVNAVEPLTTASADTPSTVVEPPQVPAEVLMTASVDTVVEPPPVPAEVLTTASVDTAPPTTASVDTVVEPPQVPAEVLTTASVDTAPPRTASVDTAPPTTASVDTAEVLTTASADTAPPPTASADPVVEPLQILTPQVPTTAELVVDAAVAAADAAVAVAQAAAAVVRLTSHGIGTMLGGVRIAAAVFRGCLSARKRLPLSEVLIEFGVKGETLRERFEEKCPPRGENAVVFYSTTLGGIRKTLEECNAVRSMVEAYGVKVLERDISMDSGFREEISVLMGNREVRPPVLFVKGRLIGGAEVVLKLEEEGKLGLLLEGIAKKESAGCCVCGGMRFVICRECNGSCNVLDEEEEMVKCGECNENGLIHCPFCC